MNRWILLSALVACTPPPGPQSPVAGTDAEAPPTCGGACGRLRLLGCHEGQKTDGGTECEELCTDIQVTPMRLPVACVAKARSVTDVRQCGVRCLP